jgi:hypothetical protein
LSSEVLDPGQHPSVGVPFRGKTGGGTNKTVHHSKLISTFFKRDSKSFQT